MIMSWSTAIASCVHVGDGTSPEMAYVRESAAQMSALAAVIVGMVRYLCLKNMVRHVADLSLLNEDGSGLDNDDCNMDLDLGHDISGHSSNLDEIQLNHTLLYNSAAIHSNGMDYMVLSNLNHSSFDMESLLINLLQQQQQQQQLVQPAENNGLNRICLLKKIKERNNPCCSNHHHSSARARAIS
jgi:hypothetical protein